MFKRFFYVFFAATIVSCSNNNNWSALEPEDNVNSKAALLDLLKFEDVPPQQNMNFYAFLINAHDQIAMGYVSCSMREIKDLIAKDYISHLLCNNIIEIQKYDTSFAPMLMLCSQKSSYDASEIEVIGIMPVLFDSFADCLAKCCGGSDCSWGLLKYCVDICSKEHGPKIYDPFRPVIAQYD